MNVIRNYTSTPVDKLNVYISLYIDRATQNRNCVLYSYRFYFIQKKLWMQINKIMYTIYLA